MTDTPSIPAAAKLPHMPVMRAVLIADCERGTIEYDLVAANGATLRRTMQATLGRVKLQQFVSMHRHIAHLAGGQATIASADGETQRAVDGVRQLIADMGVEYHNIEVRYVS